MCSHYVGRDDRQRRFNYALQPMSKDDFIEMMTTGLPDAPAYFSNDAEINPGGARSIAELPRPAALDPAEVNKLAGRGATILDVLSNTEFGAGHIPGALNIGLVGPFDSWRDN
ncbi:MAG: rhodanese-like domain-containing protein [Chloracidobacterium sp.]|nr:rhodanese-like domain-containing protein [Chloracidobacterium sp.]